ncbi:hypothetical protein V9K67_10730 [Paraflavisolibacter sp. H34]|uniref:hypothetical protein n=1 Tax=Huijunlia imazamoxiresistens TaxID=3127457 RepID=UPI003016A134
MGKKRSYKEQLPPGQGYDYDPKTHWEIKKEKAPPADIERWENRRLSRTNLDHFYPDDHGLGSPNDSDDYSDESHP